MNALKCEIGGGTEQYLKPEMEIIEMKNDDVILTSCNYGDGIIEGPEVCLILGNLIWS